MRRIALRAKIGVESEGDDVAVRDAGVGVVAADTPLELECIGYGVVELATVGMTATEDLVRVWMGIIWVFRVTDLGFQEVGEVA
ncbi:hypothetical protein ACJWDR_19000 [Streptomyces tauricus]|uniref:hypothetical protein n=1 Tax=Streptomyces tauricus TaxID=68274 RepID=UPI00387EFE1F